MCYGRKEFTRHAVHYFLDSVYLRDLLSLFSVSSSLTHVYLSYWITIDVTGLVSNVFTSSTRDWFLSGRRHQHLQYFTVTRNSAPKSLSSANTTRAYGGRSAFGQDFTMVSSIISKFSVPRPVTYETKNKPASIIKRYYERHPIHWRHGIP